MEGLPVQTLGAAAAGLGAAQAHGKASRSRSPNDVGSVHGTGVPNAKQEALLGRHGRRNWGYHCVDMSEVLNSFRHDPGSQLLEPSAQRLGDRCKSPDQPKLQVIQDSWSRSPGGSEEEVVMLPLEVL